MKKRPAIDLACIGRPLPDRNPRKTDNTGIPGRARGREGLIRDPQDDLIPYTAEQLLVLADQEFAWHDAEMVKAWRAMGFSNKWKAALEKDQLVGYFGQRFAGYRPSLGGLRRELVDSKRMPEKAFHDEPLRQGSMPITLVRLASRRSSHGTWTSTGCVTRTAVGVTLDRCLTPH